MRITHTWTDETARIGVEGLGRTVRLLHVTDVHVALADDRDADCRQACRKSYDAFARYRQDAAGNNIPTDATFDEMMAAAGGLDLDLVALTGDIVHFPARAAVESVALSAAKANVPALYTPGNHDWHFPGIEGRDELRAASRPRLEPLHHGQGAQGRHEIGGIQFLTIDDSTYQVDEAQLAFVRSHLSGGMPTVLLMHIPVSIATLRDRTIERWDSPILIADPDWDSEPRNRWGAGEDLPSTLEFARMLSTADNLVAVLCGHLHFAHADAISPRAVQYVGPPAYLGQKRLVELGPL